MLERVEALYQLVHEVARQHYIFVECSSSEVTYRYMSAFQINETLLVVSPRVRPLGIVNIHNPSRRFWRLQHTVQE